MRKMHEWNEIKSQYHDYLLVGNGASIAIDNRLSYKSLYEKVCQTGKLDKELMRVFDYFETSNFEYIMKLLLEANKINESLTIIEQKTQVFYHQLRDVLIQTIRNIHPTYQQVKKYLPKIALFLASFNSIVSLNYDLLIYWAMLHYNSKNAQWFKDAFVDGKFKKDFSWFYQKYPPATGSTLVFYPHGSLFLATDVIGNETKLSKTQDDFLLETILTKWKDKEYIPLFVSEGNTTEKFHAITRSSYLNTVYESVLSKIHGNVVIYGWSMSEQDDHILEAIDRRDVTKLAVSVHMSNPQYDTYCRKIEDKVGSTHNLRNVDLVFFSSISKDCWIY